MNLTFSTELSAIVFVVAFWFWFIVAFITPHKPPACLRGLCFWAEGVPLFYLLGVGIFEVAYRLYDHFG